LDKEMKNWISTLDYNELANSAIVLHTLTPGEQLGENKIVTDETIADLMVHGGPVFMAMAGDEDYEPMLNRDNRPPREWWIEVKREFNELLCLDTPKYESIRKELKEKSSAGTAVILGLIVAAVAKHLDSVASGAVVSFIALCLATTLKIGREAYCNLQETNDPTSR
jgi:hypothetical protein